MKFKMPRNNVDQVCASFVERVKAMDIPAKVEIEVTEKRNLRVKIKKMGTTTLIFYCTVTEKGLLFELATQDISWWHKKYMDDFKTELATLVVKCGGSVV